MQLSLWLYLLSYLHLGLSIFTTNPTNVTVCQGSPAVFTCAIDVLKQINWYINGSDYSLVTGTQVAQSGTQSTLTVSNTSQLNGSSIQCYYVQSGSVIYSNMASLSVQAPPAAPDNLDVTAFNTSTTNLVWEPPPNVQSPPLLSYGVEVRNGSGVVVYRGTVTVPQLIISTPDPCDLYEATVTAQYMIANLTCTGSSSSKLLGVSPPTVHFTTSLVFSMSPQDNVSVNMFVQSGVCYYKVVAISGSDVFPFPSVKPLPQYGGGQFNITISLPSNKYYNLIVTAFNGYGNISSVVVISTCGIIDISVNPSSPTGLVCVFNPGSLAIGCLVSLTDTSTGTIYCRVIGRTLNRTVSIATCPSSNGPLSTGSYSVVVYTIESDGSLSPLAAISGKILNIYSTVGPSTVSQAPASIPTTPDNALPGGIIGGVLGGVLLVTIIIIMLIIALCVINKQKQKRSTLQSGPLSLQRLQSSTAKDLQSEQGSQAEQTGSTGIDEHDCEDEQALSNEGAPDGLQGQEVQPSSTESHYAVIDTSQATTVLGKEIRNLKGQLEDKNEELNRMGEQLIKIEQEMKEQQRNKEEVEKQLTIKVQKVEEELRDKVQQIKELRAKHKKMKELSQTLIDLRAKYKKLKKQGPNDQEMKKQLRAKCKEIKEQMNNLVEQLPSEDPIILNKNERKNHPIQFDMISNSTTSSTNTER